MSATDALALAGDGEAAPARFDHVLRDVVLTGPAMVLARGLDEVFLSEAGWDPATRVLSPPAGHWFLGRPACSAPGCTATSAISDRVCHKCRERLEPGLQT